MKDKLVLKKINDSDLTIIKNILKSNHLVYKDIGDEGIEFFFAYEDSSFIGIIGLEKFDNLGLLRSMVINKEFRNKGYGKKVCEAFFKTVKKEGINELYLLTYDAKDFFEKVGFKVVKRKDVPEQIKHTKEFSSLCPASTDCLKIELNNKD